MTCITIPARRHRPPKRWTRRYLIPAPDDAFVFLAHTRYVAERAIISQKIKSDIKSPANTTPIAAPA